MTTQTMAAVKARRNAASSRAKCTLLAAAATLLLAPAATQAADPPGSQPAAKTVTLEPISGSTAKRVILSPKAAERLGIEIGKVGEESVLLRQMVSGLVTAPVDSPPAVKPGGGGLFGGFAQAGGASAPGAPASPAGQSAGVAPPAAMVPAIAAAPQAPAGGFAGLGKAIAAPAPQQVAAAAPPRANAPMVGDAWVQVTLSPGEYERLAKDKPARLLALSTRDKLGNEVLAQPSGMAPVEDPKRSMLSLYYMVPGKDHGLALNSRLRVELPISGNEDKLKVVPYSAVYYDGKGAAWVYVNTKPLTFERQRIGVDRVVRDVAVLSDGPPVGTPVVTVGASMLFGAEIFGK